MGLYSHLLAGTREGKHWGKEECFYGNRMRKSGRGWLIQNGGWALKDGRWRMGTGGWTLEDGHWRMGIWRDSALEGGPNGHWVSPEM